MNKHFAFFAFLLAVLLSLNSAKLFAQFKSTGGSLGGDVYNFSKSNGNKIWAASEDGLYYTLNNGGTWYKPSIDPKLMACNAVLAFGDTIVAIFSSRLYMPQCDQDYYFAVSFDNGALFTTNYTGFTSYMLPTCGYEQLKYSLNKNGNKIEMCYAGLHTYETADWGQSWTIVNTINSSMSLSYFFRNEDKVIHKYGNIYAYTFDNFTTTHVDTIVGNRWPIAILDTNLFFENTAAGDSLFRANSVGEIVDTILAFNFDSALSLNYFRIIGDTFLVRVYDVYTFEYTIYASYDNGITWQNANDQLTQSLPSATINLNANEMLVSSRNNIFKYDYITDSIMSYPEDIRGVRLNCIASNQSDMYAMGNNYLYKSSDDGVTWNKKLTYSSNLGRVCLDVVHDTIIAVADDSLYISFDAGNSWNKQLITISPLFFSIGVAYFDNKIFINNRTNDSIYVSSDYGITWQGIVGGNGNPNNISILKKDSSGLFFLANDTDSIRLYYYANNQVLTYSTFPHVLSSSAPTSIYIQNNFWIRSNYTNVPEYSLNGINYLPINLPNGLQNAVIFNVIYSGGKYYAQYDTTIIFSVDGINWNTVGTQNMYLVLSNLYCPLFNHKGKPHYCMSGKGIYRLIFNGRH